MIDNQKQVKTLIQLLKTNLPIPVMATDDLINSLNKNNKTISSDSHIQIEDVLYMGDEGGICCHLKIAGQKEVAVIVSLTHLRISNTHQLSSDVRAYQIARTKKLAKNH